MLKRRTLALALATLGAATGVAACGGDGAEPAAEPAPLAEPAPAEPPADEPAAETGGMLVGTVGPGLTITLTKDGNPVTELAAGTYTIEVDDQAAGHNFHLTGPGVDEATDVLATGKTTWEATLAAGEYRFLCDPHAALMNGTFVVA